MLALAYAATAASRVQRSRPCRCRRTHRSPLLPRVPRRLRRNPSTRTRSLIRCTRCTGPFRRNPSIKAPTPRCPWSAAAR